MVKRPADNVLEFKNLFIPSKTSTRALPSIMSEFKLTRQC